MEPLGVDTSIASGCKLEFKKQTFEKIFCTYIKSPNGAII